MALTPIKQARVEAYVDAHSRTRESLVRNLLVLLARFWAALSDKYDQGEVQTYTDRVAAAVVAARLQQARLTDAYLTRVLREMDTDPGRPGVQVDPLPRGIPLGEEFVRPVKEYRRLRLLGLEEFEASERALARSRLIGETDVTLAMRDASRDRLVAADRITGWRRVIHPELSAGGTCGLCIAASDRVYSVAELLPIHARCACSVSPVVEGQADPGGAMNRADLRTLYAAAGSTGAADLKRVKFRVNEHGELGRVLTASGDHFRDADEVAADTNTAPAA